MQIMTNMAIKAANEIIAPVITMKYWHLLLQRFILQLRMICTTVFKNKIIAIIPWMDA